MSFVHTPTCLRTLPHMCTLLHTCAHFHTCMHIPTCVCTLPHMYAHSHMCAQVSFPAREHRDYKTVSVTLHSPSFEAKSLPEPLELAVSQQAGSQQAGITAVHRIPSLLCGAGIGTAVLMIAQWVHLSSGPTSSQSMCMIYRWESACEL